MNEVREHVRRARHLQAPRDSLGVPEPEPGMVRNTKALMLCSLLALATGLALGSRLAPVTGDVATPPMQPSARAGLLDDWNGRVWRAEPAADAPPSDALPRDALAQASEPTGLEGDRQPRMPRMSRETMARPSR